MVLLIYNKKRERERKQNQGPFEIGSITKSQWKPFCGKKAKAVCNVAVGLAPPRFSENWRLNRPWFCGSSWF